jgi:hypothetical protein
MIEKSPLPIRRDVRTDDTSKVLMRECGVVVDACFLQHLVARDPDPAPRACGGSTERVLFFDHHGAMPVGHNG